MHQKTHAHDQDTDFVVQCIRRFRAVVDQQCRCRGCHTHCSMWSNICETCGTQDPVQLPWKWAVLVGITGVALLAIGAWVG